MVSPLIHPIRDARTSELSRVLTLWEVSGLTRPWNDAAADFARALASPSSSVLVEDRLAGSVMVGDDGHRGWVYYLAVAPDARHRGVGRALMAAAEAWLVARGVPKIQLMVRDGNLDALAFYAALGLERQPVVTLGRFLGEGKS